MGPNMVQVPNPVVTMTNRLALALRSLSMRSADAHVQGVLAIAPAMPEVMDTVDWDFYCAERARLAGCDPQLIRTREGIAEIRNARAQAMQAQQAAMMAKEASAAVKNVGGIEKARELVGG
jgi:hypothetical protein